MANEQPELSEERPRGGSRVVADFGLRASSACLPNRQGLRFSDFGFGFLGVFIGLFSVCGSTEDQGRRPEQPARADYQRPRPGVDGAPQGEAGMPSRRVRVLEDMGFVPLGEQNRSRCCRLPSFGQLRGKHYIRRQSCSSGKRWLFARAARPGDGAVEPQTRSSARRFRPARHSSASTVCPGAGPSIPVPGQRERRPEVGIREILRA